MLSVFLLSVSLALDAFAASVCCAIGSGRRDGRLALKLGLWFGGFQAGMTLIGGLFGRRLSLHLWRLGALLAFGLLLFLGIRMALSALSPLQEEDRISADLRPGTLALLALATSLDALAAGVSLTWLNTGLAASAALIGLTAFALSALGAVLGRQAGIALRRWSGAAGGAVLIWLGIRVLLSVTG